MSSAEAERVASTIKRSITRQLMTQGFRVTWTHTGKWAQAIDKAMGKNRGKK
jgi:hypothetical protein